METTEPLDDPAFKLRGTDVRRNWPFGLEVLVALDTDFKGTTICGKLCQADGPEFREPLAEIAETPGDGFIVGIDFGQQPGGGASRGRTA